GGGRVPHVREPDGAQGAPASQHERRQPRRMLHARARAPARGRASDPRDIHEPGARRPRVDGLLGSDGDTGEQRDLRLGGNGVTSATYLPAHLPIPLSEADGLDAPYWEGTRRGELKIQRCQDCHAWQWGPEWMCHRCRSLRMGWETIAGRGRIYSWERAWHPVHAALKGHGPYIVVLVELPECDNVRMIGNLLGDPQQCVKIG